MSRLKRIILHERANKAFADASASVESAAAAARLAAALRNNIREQLRVHMRLSLLINCRPSMLSAAVLVGGSTGKVAASFAADCCAWVTPVHAMRGGYSMNLAWQVTATSGCEVGQMGWSLGIWQQGCAMQVAGEALILEHRGGTMPHASAITQLQVLEVAAVEAERRVVDADRFVSSLCPWQLCKDCMYSLKFGATATGVVDCLKEISLWDEGLGVDGLCARNECGIAGK